MLVSEQDFEKYLTISRGLSKKSVKTYLQRFQIIKRWVDGNKLTLNKRTVEDFLFGKKIHEKLSNAAVNTYIQTLKHIDGCYKYHDLPFGFTDGRKGLPKVRSIRIPLSEDEITKLFDTHLDFANRNGVDCTHLDDNYLIMTKFLYFSACRFEEAASLMVENLGIDDGRALLIDTKNKESRFLFFEPIKDDMRQFIAGKHPNELVFTNSVGKRMYASDFNNILKLRAKKAGITKHVHAHLLRHTYASQFYNATHDITMVATVLGHKDIQTTYDTYVHLDTDTVQRATNRHRLASKYIPSEEALDNIRKAIEGLKIGEDTRFDFDLHHSNNELTVSVKIREV